MDYFQGRHCTWCLSEVFNYIIKLSSLGIRVKKTFLRVLLGGCKNMSRVGLSMVSGTVEEDSGEPVEGAFLEEELCFVLSVGYS